jgi:hypothetical protein
VLSRIDERAERCRQILLEDGDAEEKSRRALAVWDEHPLAWIQLAFALSDGGETAEALEAAWRGVRGAPGEMTAYLLLRQLLEAAGQPAEAWHAFVFGLRCGAGSARASQRGSPFFAELQEIAPDLDLSAPESYEAILEVVVSQRPADVPERAPERLAGYDVFTRMLADACVGFEPELLDELREKAAECAPILHAALRYWWLQPETLEDEAAAMVLALLGEFAGPEAATDVLTLCSSDRENIFSHANWAAWRMGQRMPVEMLAAVREITAEASASLRCGLAEHLGALPASVDTEAALRDLLSGYPPEDNASYLLLAVSDALARRGHRSASRAVCKENLPKLSGDVRRETELTLRSGAFEPELAEARIMGQTIEDVFLSELLMTSDADEDEEDEENKEDGAATHPDLGRNDPCWCGSGKKYKKCHLASDQRPHEMPDGERLLLAIVEAARSWQTQADTVMARELYFGTNFAAELPEEQVEPFFFWLACDYHAPSSGKTAAEEYLRRRGHELDAEDRRQVEAWRDSRFGFWETVRVEEGKGVELRDYFGGEPFFVHDVRSSRALVKWDCLLTRVEKKGARTAFSGNGTQIPRSMLPRLLERIEQARRPDQTPSEFVRAGAHRIWRMVRDLAEDTPPPQLANTDGEKFEFSSATYEVRDPAALEAALRACPGLDEHEPGVDYAWVGPAGQGPSTLLGSLKIAAGKLTLECNSRPRLARGKSLIEQAAGTAIRYLRDRFESVAQAQARLPKSRDEAGTPELDPEFARRVETEAQDRHYAGWPDTPLPALNGLTPRAAMRTKSGRAQVEELIRTFENGEERRRKSGREPYDFSRLRAQLGLPAE